MLEAGTISQLSTELGQIKLINAKSMQSNVSGAKSGDTSRLEITAYRGAEPKCSSCRGRVQNNAEQGIDSAGAKHAKQRGSHVSRAVSRAGAVITKPAVAAALS